MAWQTPSAMAGNGGGAEQHPNGGAQTVGMEYTLQGVMRFLQTEWHRHERDRNAWDIERAEMKIKIAKLEGENRASKKMQDASATRIKMLEAALKREREKSKSALGETQPKEVSKEDKKTEPLDAAAKKALLEKLSPDTDPDLASPLRQETQREKSRQYLERCLQEITYLLTPPAQAPPPNPALSNHFGHPGMSEADSTRQAMEEAYMNQQRLKGQQISAASLAHAAPNHVSLASNLEQAAMQALNPEQPTSEQQTISMTTPMIGLDTLPQPQSVPSSLDQVEKITHRFDNTGRQIDQSTVSKDINKPEFDWDFEESNVPGTDNALEKDVSIPPGSPSPPAGHKRKASAPRRRSRDTSVDAGTLASATAISSVKTDASNFKVRFALSGHLDVVRSVIFTGGGSPSEPEICTAGDDGVIKRWILPATFNSSHSNPAGDIDVQSYFTHRGHTGIVTALAAYPSVEVLSGGGRAAGDGWIFSGGQDATVRVWERGRVDPKATLDGHTDAVWCICALPGTAAMALGNSYGSQFDGDRILLASGSSDGTVKIWAVSSCPQQSSGNSGSRRGASGSRRHSISAGSNFPSSPQPSTASDTPFEYTLIHTISRADSTASPTSISPLSPTGETFIVSYTDAAILIFDTRTGEEIVGMASLETYDGTSRTGVNAVVASIVGLEGVSKEDAGRGVAEEAGATGLPGGVEGVIISGHEDRYIRFFDANSGQCTYNMLAHPSAISSLYLSPDSRELVSAGHDASLRFWSLEKRSCTQEITSHRLMRGEGVCSVVWSQDGRWVVSGGGDGVVKVFSR